jgi:hypothetical protein
MARVPNGEPAGSAICSAAPTPVAQMINREIERFALAIDK